MMALRVGMCVAAALAVLAGWPVAAPDGSFAEAAAAAKVAPAAKAAKVRRMTALLAYEPAWLPDSKRMVFFGNRQANEPTHVYVWEPATDKLFRVTERATSRHSLAVSHENRVAYVDHASPTTTTPAGAGADVTRPADGPDTLVVRDLRTNAEQVILAGGWVLPRSVSWSPDGQKLAFITLDRSGAQRLAVATPGQGVSLVNLASYEFQGMVGWANAREVVFRAKPLTKNTPGEEQLVVVGRDGARAYRSAEDAKLSPDGRWLLTRTNDGTGVALRLVTGGFRVLNQTATAYDWSPEANKVYAAIDRDVVALDLKGRVLRRWSGLASLAVGQVNVSPDGKQLAFSADYGLAVVSVQ